MEQKIMPSGAMPPKEDEQQQAEAGQGAAAEAGTGDQSGGEKAPELILGKFKTPDEVAKAYQELESAHGRQSSEVGDLRKQNDLLLQAVAGGKGTQQQQVPNQQQQSVEPDYDAQMAAIQKQLDEGDISVTEALKAAAEISAQKGAQLASTKIMTAQKQEKIQAVQKDFLDQNPDYAQFVNSPDLQAYMAKNPLHDQFSAYFAWKADQNAAAVETAKKTGFEEGKSAVEKLAQGSEAARNVISGQGAAVRNANPTPPPPAWKHNPEDVRKSMYAKLDQVRTKK